MRERDEGRGRVERYAGYFTGEYLMGPNSIYLLDELLSRYPLMLSANDDVLDLGCGKGLSSLFLAGETGARVFANDLWIGTEDNLRRFQTWGVEGRVIPQCQDATCLTFPGEKFAAVFSVDAYHYFAGEEGFFEEKILPFVRPGGCVLIAVPGIRQELEGRQTALLTPWLGEEAYMFRSGERWRELLGESEEIAAREVWEMENFSPAWDSWLGTDNPHAEGDRAFFESVIRPYTCFIGMAVKKKG